MAETATSANGSSEGQQDILNEAEKIARGGVWTEEAVAEPISWAGESSAAAMPLDPPRLGGLSRPDRCYDLLEKALSRPQIDALVEIVLYELMSQNGLPGKTLKTGIASLIATAEQETRTWADGKMSTITTSAGRDESARQHVKILENKLTELEKMFASRNRDEVVIIERATDVLAAYESKKKDEGISGDDLLKLQQEKAELTEALEKLQTRATKLPAESSSAKPTRSKRNLDLY